LTPAPTGNSGSAARAAPAARVVAERFIARRQSVLDVEFGPNAVVRVQAMARGSGAPASPTWTWKVTVTDTNNVTTPVTKTTLVDNTSSSLQFPVTILGKYVVTATVDGSSPCAPPTPYIFMTVVPGPLKYLLRVTATGLPIQDKSITLADPQPITFMLTPGIPANISPQRSDMNGGLLTSYIRITDAVSGVSIDGDSSHGPLMAPLLMGASYDVLVFPLDSYSYAPQLVSGNAPFSPPLLLDQGVRIAATTLDGAGNGVANARTVLRRGTLPSTIGVSDANGFAAVYARTGAAPLEVDIVPPIGSGLPSATAGAGDPTTDPGVMLGAGATSLNLSMKWNSVTSAPLTVHVLAPGGAAIGEGIRVRATSKAAPGVVGTLTVQPSVGPSGTLHPTGSTSIEVLTDESGTAAFSALPIGDYTVRAIPASTPGSITASSQAITSATMTVATGGSDGNLILTTKSMLTGMLLPLSDSPGAQIIALDQSVIASGAVALATVDSTGTYQLFVDPGHSYEVVARPAASSTRGRAVLFSSVSDATRTLPNATLPVGHPVQGQISAGGTRLGGSLVQIFCPPTSTRCPDPTFPLAETIAGSDGTFNLILPDAPAN
jgi:hypothetical protein